MQHQIWFFARTANLPNLLWSHLFSVITASRRAWYVSTGRQILRFSSEDRRSTPGGSYPVGGCTSIWFDLIPSASLIWFDFIRFNSIRFDLIYVIQFESIWFDLIRFDSILFDLIPVNRTAGLPMSYKLGPPWNAVIPRSDFKSEAIFGFISPNYTG